jgi:putative membrane protein
MPISQSDPRVFFAAERTLLAWIRTGLTIMALGFVIARFGLFLQLVALQAPAGRIHANSGLSAALGIFFVLTGALASLIATAQHHRFIATLPEGDLPPSYSTGFIVVFGIFMGVLGLGLAGYLAFSEM